MSTTLTLTEPSTPPCAPVSGFILGTAAGGVRICQIPGRMHYEAAWPVRKLALRYALNSEPYTLKLKP